QEEPLCEPRRIRQRVGQRLAGLFRHRSADQAVHRATRTAQEGDRQPQGRQIRLGEADKSVSEAEKKEELADLAAALNTAKLIQFKENIALVQKYFDKLAPLMQEQASRPAD